MKEGISNIWLIGIIIVFILIFACYITITINYTAAFKIKNEALRIIEKHKGMTTGTSSIKSIVYPGQMVTNAGALETINLYLAGKAYTAKGTCPDGSDGVQWYGVSEIFNSSYTGPASQYEPATGERNKYYYCFAKFQDKKITGFDVIYYRVRFFYKMEFPALSEWLAIRVDGMTDEIYSPTDDGFTTNSLDKLYSEYTV